MPTASSIRWAVGVLLLCCGLCFGDQLILKDGTKLDGTILPTGSGYWVKLPDGSTRTVPGEQVAKFVPGAAAETPTPGTRPVSPPSANTTVQFAAAKREAEAVDLPASALAIWQKFIDTKPSPADLDAAKAEMTRWEKLSADGAERINGKWLAGEERKALLAKASAIVDEANDLARQNKTLQAVKKLEEAIKLYPNSAKTNYLLGFLALTSDDFDSAINYFQRCQKLDPQSVGAYNNMAVALFAKKQYERAILLFFKAAQMQDSPPLATNLVKALQTSPREVRSSLACKSASDAAKLLAAKYNLDPAANWQAMNWALLPPGYGSGATTRPGGLSSGTGFIVSATGTIVTNRHVVQGAKTLTVIMPDGSKRPATVVVIDDQQDLAVIEIKGLTNLPTLKLAKPDSPAEGTQCYAMGYPMIDRMGSSVKITQGIVSGTGRAGVGADVVIDAKVNPGNSGGPLLDSHGHVIGIVSMKSMSSEMEDSYGMAISVGRIRDFFTRHNLPQPPSEDGGEALNAEQVAAQGKPAVVCIMATH